MDLIIQLFLLMPIGFFFGRASEKKHLKNLAERESANSTFFVTDLKGFYGKVNHSVQAKMFVGEVTIASDYYKRFAGSIRNFFGGEVRSFSTLMLRARREALLRIVEQAKSEGYNAICNLRMESADIGGSNTSNDATIMVSIIAYATAYKIDT